VIAGLLAKFRRHWIALCAILVALPVLAGTCIAEQGVIERQRVISLELQGLERVTLLDSVLISIERERSDATSTDEQQMLNAIVHASDDSGLTFDAQTTGIDYSDALAYRLPPAIDRMRSAELMTRESRLQRRLTLSERLSITGDRVEAGSLAKYAYDDLDDAMGRDAAGNAALAGKLERTESSMRSAQSGLGSLALAPRPSRAQISAVEKRAANAVANVTALVGGIGPILGGELRARMQAYDLQLRTITIAGIGTILGIILLGFGVDYLSTERYRRQMDALKHKASHDDLTGLLNRAAFLDGLRRRLAREPQQTVLFVDLNHFKQINDEYGHDCGDTVLATVAARLREVVCADALLSRYGGDEFAIAISVPDEVQIRRVATEIGEEIARPIDLHSGQVRVESSVGFAIARDDDISEVLRRADESMYRAKRAGRLRIV
jgi:diguanylate cyclase (GGDEF)-like protein